MQSEEIFKIHSITRQKLAGFLDHLTAEQLADIPYGFRNNIWWNIVHVVVTQQLLTYYLTENEMLIEREWIDKYKKGSVPDAINPTLDEIYLIKNLLLTTRQQLHLDYLSGKLNKDFNYSTSYGYTLKNIEDALLFNLMHENMHLGTVNAMKILV
ncbi:MAG: DinB family protein [Flavobacteriaceae bacterium]|nr:DinB family protein [Flavobacteriaceae bacterium]